MAAKRYTLVSFSDAEMLWELHKPGCAKIRESASLAGARKQLIKTDLEGTDEEVLDDVEAFLEMTMEDVYLCGCTGYATEESSEQESDLEEDDEELDEDEKPLPAAASAAARASQVAARERLLRQVEEAVDKLVAERGADDVGLGGKQEWDEERLATCTDDYVYDLAVEVRKLRSRGDSWWRVAYELHLPGSGASNKQGRKGSAFARRLWRAAWGKTYLGERGQRESKITREARAMENLGRSYFSEDVSDAEVVRLVTGQMLHWVTRLKVKEGLVTSAQEAYVHHDPRLVRVKQGPVGRYLEFYEQVDANQLKVDPRLAIAKSGPLRAVYVDRITRVGV
jgi:hypothetical protein